MSDNKSGRTQDGWSTIRIRTEDRKRLRLFAAAKDIQIGDALHEAVMLLPEILTSKLKDEEQQ